MWRAELVKAASFFRRCNRIREELLGIEHPSTKRVRDTLRRLLIDSLNIPSFLPGY